MANVKGLVLQFCRHPVATVNEHRELRYLVAGTASELIEYASFLLLIAVSPHLLYIWNSVSFLLGVLAGFCLHKFWTFRGQQQFKTHQQLVGYVTLAGINFVAINVFLGIYVETFRLSAALAKILAIATTVVWTYLISNYIIFRRQDDKS
jgi:putative flippase GtrA